MRTKRAEDGLDQSISRRKVISPEIGGAREAQLGRAQVTVDLGLPAHRPGNVPRERPEGSELRLHLGGLVSNFEPDRAGTATCRGSDCTISSRKTPSK